MTMIITRPSSKFFYGSFFCKLVFQMFFIEIVKQQKNHRRISLSELELDSKTGVSSSILAGLLFSRHVISIFSSLNHFINREPICGSLQSWNFEQTTPEKGENVGEETSRNCVVDELNDMSRLFSKLRELNGFSG